MAKSKAQTEKKPQSNIVKAVGAFVGFVVVACLIRSGVNAIMAANEEVGTARGTVLAMTSHAQEEGLVSESAVSAARGYSPDTAALSSILEAGVWSVGTSSLYFGPGFYVYETEEGLHAQTFVLGEVSTSRDEQGGEQIKVYTCAANTGSGTVVLTVKESAEEKRDAIRSASCSAFPTKGAEYVMSELSESIEVDRPSDEIVRLLGGDEGYEKVAKALDDYAARNEPSSSHAKWDGDSSIDYVGKTVSMHYRLTDDALASLLVECTYNEEGLVSCKVS